METVRAKALSRVILRRVQEAGGDPDIIALDERQGGKQIFEVWTASLAGFLDVASSNLWLPALAARVTTAMHSESALAWNMCERPVAFTDPRSSDGTVCDFTVSLEGNREPPDNARALDALEIPVFTDGVYSEPDGYLVVMVPPEAKYCFSQRYPRFSVEGFSELEALRALEASILAAETASPVSLVAVSMYAAAVGKLKRVAYVEAALARERQEQVVSGAFFHG